MEPTLLPIQTMLLLLLLFGVAVLLIADAADHADAVVLVVVDLSVLWSICSYPRWIVRYHTRYTSTSTSFVEKSGTLPVRYCETGGRVGGGEWES